MNRKELISKILALKWHNWMMDSAEDFIGFLIENDDVDAERSVFMLSIMKHIPKKRLEEMVS